MHDQTRMALLRSQVVEHVKHLPGKHDQASHGSWAFGRPAGGLARASHTSTKTPGAAIRPRSAQIDSARAVLGVGVPEVKYGKAASAFIKAGEKAVAEALKNRPAGLVGDAGAGDAARQDIVTYLEGFHNPSRRTRPWATAVRWNSNRPQVRLSLLSINLGDVQL